MILSGLDPNPGDTDWVLAAKWLSLLKANSLNFGSTSAPSSSDSLTTLYYKILLVLSGE